MLKLMCAHKWRVMKVGDSITNFPVTIEAIDPVTYHVKTHEGWNPAQDYGLHFVDSPVCCRRPQDYGDYTRGFWVCGPDKLCKECKNDR